MDTATVDEVNTSHTQRRAKARKDASGQEATIKLDAIRERIDHLVLSYRHASDAAETFSEDVKAVAEKAGINAAAVKKFVVARAGEHFEDKKRDVMQMALVFEHVGE